MVREMPGSIQQGGENSWKSGTYVAREKFLQHNLCNVVIIVVLSRRLTFVWNLMWTFCLQTRLKTMTQTSLMQFIEKNATKLQCVLTNLCTCASCLLQICLEKMSQKSKSGNCFCLESINSWLIENRNLSELLFDLTARVGWYHSVHGL